MKKAISILTISGMLASLNSCAPVYSELQDASTTPEKTVALTPTFTSTSISDNGNRFHVQNHAGLQVGYGLTQNFDLKFRYERIWYSEDDFSFGTNVFALGAKVGIIKDRLAFSLPLGFAASHDETYFWSLQPSILFTSPIIPDKFTFTIAPKFMMFLEDDSESLWAVNAGFAFSSNLESWALRPEYGIAGNFEGGGYYGQFSIGFTKFIGW